KPVARRPIWFHPGRNGQEAYLRTEGAIEIVRAECASMQRTGDEFPERREVGEPGARRIIMVRRGVVDVGSNPDDIRNVLLPDESEQLDRKSTRLNSSHDQISYAVFCLKKKKN